MTAFDYRVYLEGKCVYVSDDAHRAVDRLTELKELHGSGTPVVLVPVDAEEASLSARDWGVRPFSVSPDEAAESWRNVA